MTDLTATKTALRALEDSNEQFRQLAEHMPQVFWLMDAALESTIYVSPACQTISGRPPSEFVSDPQAWLKAVHTDDRERVQYSRKERVPLGTYDIEYRVIHANGSVRWIRDRAFPVRNANGDIYRIAGIAEDITERKLTRERLAYLANYDNLTGLPNRTLLNDRLQQSIAQAQRNNWITGVLFLDLDHFKRVNDTMGHAAGDLLLQQVAVRLTRFLRPIDTVGRIGGDEFVIILSELSGVRDAGLVAQKVLKILAAPFDLDGNPTFITASIGITLYPSDSDSIDTLLRDADAAMYSAKAAGRNNCQYRTATIMNERALARQQLENGLRHALKHGEFILHYQPKVTISSGKLSGLEALLRWQPPDGELVIPDQFIPLLEETGLIVSVGEWVARSACAQIHAWRKAGLTPVPVAINLSARQLRQPGFVTILAHALKEFGVEPELIHIEITESSLMENPEEAIILLQELKTLGIRLEADDFGTGYSSLSYLRRFPLDALKIDRSFVRDITTNTDDAIIARAVITLAHSLGLKVVAEGVENEQQLAFLGNNHCDEAQGYLFTHPMTVEDCTALLAGNHFLHRGHATDTANLTPAVLIVDDDSDHLLLTRKWLHKDGHSILTAMHTREAFELLASRRVDVVVSDQNMPGMNGVEFLRRVKLMYPHIVRIMLSGAEDAVTAIAAINEGEVHKFFVKGRDDQLLRREIMRKLRHASGSSGGGATHPQSD